MELRLLLRGRGIVRRLGRRVLVADARLLGLAADLVVLLSSKTLSRRSKKEASGPRERSGTRRQGEIEKLLAAEKEKGVASSEKQRSVWPPSKKCRGGAGRNRNSSVKKVFCQQKRAALWVSTCGRFSVSFFSSFSICFSAPFS